MPTAPLGENPYLYQDGPTVPLRQQKTGGYAANGFGNRVFYTPEGRLPDSTLAPGLAPTAGQIARQNLSGAGLIGAVVGGAATAQSVYAQGGGLFQGLGAGLGSTGGAIAGATAGAAAGAAAGGAAGSAVPVVGNVAGAGAGTVAGTIGGGLAGGAVGGAVGGGVGRAVDEFFWPSPAEPAIGIPGQPAEAAPLPARGSGTPAGALGGGPVTVPSDPIFGDPLFPGGQSPNVIYRFSAEVYDPITESWSAAITGGANESLPGPITGVSISKGAECNNGFGNSNQYRLIATNGTSTLDFPLGCISAPGPGGVGVRSSRPVRDDGQPDTGGDPAPPQIGETEPERAPNPSRAPYRPLGTDGAKSPFAPTSPPPTPGDRPWPEREANPAPDAEPFADSSPFKAPAPAPNFTPTPTPARAPAPTQTPTRPTDPLNPGPSGPLPTAEPERKSTPWFIPIPIPTESVNKPDFQIPEIPYFLIPGLRQPATTPSGSPQQLINPSTAPEFNPNVQPPPPPTPNKTDNSCPCNTPIINKLDAFEKKMDRALGGAGLAADGGIFAYLQTMQAFAEKAWAATRIQKVLDALTLITVLHNASMISRDVGETLGYALSQALDVLGIDDEEGNALDVNSWFGTQANNFFENIFGADRWHGLNEFWNKANRVISSASSIIWTLRTIGDGTQEVLEWTAENTGKIGNALKKWGVVGERAYPWMAERVKAQDAYRRKFSRILDGLETAEEAASSYGMVISEVNEITQEIGELGEQRQRFAESVRDMAPDSYPDNSEFLAPNEQAGTNARSGPEVTPVDMEPGSNGTS